MLKAAERERLIEYHPASPSLIELGHSSAAFADIRIPEYWVSRVNSCISHRSGMLA